MHSIMLIYKEDRKDVVDNSLHFLVGFVGNLDSHCNYLLSKVPLFYTRKEKLSTLNY